MKVVEYIIVGVGGVLGSITRYLLSKLISEKCDSIIPMGTMSINITGALLLGIVSSLYTGGNLYLLLAEGYLGAYTTFSTFMYEGFNLFQENEKINAAVYILGTLFLGIIGFMIGMGIVKIFELM